MTVYVIKQTFVDILYRPKVNQIVAKLSNFNQYRISFSVFSINGKHTFPKLNAMLL